jgi:lysophospholipase L1-like esterase
MFAVSVAFCLVLAEIVVRIARPQPRLVITPGGLYTPDPPGLYRLSPGYEGRIFNRVEYSNAIRINSEGLRGPEVDPDPDQATRILVIGDSFVFGVGVEDDETFTARLPEHLAGSLGSTEGLNAGIPAFGVPDAESWLRRHGLKLEPDVVVMAVFLGNDLADAAHAGDEVVIVDGLLAPKQSSQGIKVWLHRHSHLYVAIKGLLEQPGFRPLRAKLGLGEPWKVRTLREEFGVYRRNVQTEMASAIEATDRALAGLAAMATESGFALGAVLIPSEIQIDPGRWQAGLAGLDLDPEQYDPAAPTQVFKGLLDRHQIPTLDLTGVFAEGLARGDALYFRFDRHWTTDGHAVAAERLAEFLSAAVSVRPAD